MAALEMSMDGDVLSEEARHFVHVSLFHIEFYRDLIRRTGLLEEAEGIGWSSGTEEYTGVMLYDGESDHLNRILAILDLPVEDAVLGPCGIQDEGQDLNILGLDGEPIESNEEDLFIQLFGDEEELARLMLLLQAIDPSIEFCRQVPPSPDESLPTTLAEAWTRRDAPDDRPHLGIFVKWGAAETFGLYDGLFKHLIRAWEVMRGGKTY